MRSHDDPPLVHAWLSPKHPSQSATWTAARRTMKDLPLQRPARDGVVDRWFSRVLAVLPLLGVGLVLALAGWPQSPAMTMTLLRASRIVAGMYGFLVWVQWAWVDGARWETWRGYFFGPGLAMLILASAVFDEAIGRFFAANWTGYSIHTWLIGLAALQQLLAIVTRFQEWMPAFERGFLSRASPGLVLVSTFGLLISAGSALLKMPKVTTDGISWIDALFTSTSAVCVTGLIVVDTATAFTQLGQAIVLILIQLGAFGIVTLTFFLAVLSGQGFSVSSRVFLRDLLSVESMRNLSTTLAAIVGLTVVFEVLGAIGLCLAWGATLGDGNSAWWVALFHSVSAFCNAGFSIFTDGLADPRAASHFQVQGIIMVLIVLGGIGFPVLLDLVAAGRRMLKPKERRQNCRIFSTHTSLVLLLTSLLLAGGTLLLWFGGGAISEDMPTSGAWEALFNAITARTAGFNISDISRLPSASTAIIILLMFIGGSPGGVAGGIKTTTFAMAVLNLRRILLNRRDVQIFGRRIEDVLTNRAFAVVLISILWVFCATTTIFYLQPEFPFMDILFECVSAFGTVGLSRGITAELSTGSKLIIVLTMFAGRIGVLNLFFSLLPAKPEVVRFRYPRERIIVE